VSSLAAKLKFEDAIGGMIFIIFYLSWITVASFFYVTNRWCSKPVGLLRAQGFILCWTYDVNLWCLHLWNVSYPHFLGSNIMSFKVLSEYVTRILTSHYEEADLSIPSLLLCCCNIASPTFNNAHAMQIWCWKKMSTT
jgi:hypothetical protein